MSPRSLVPALALLTGAGALGCSSDPGAAGPPTFPATALLSMPSNTGAFAIEIRTSPEQPPSRGIDAIEYRVTQKGSASSAAEPVDGLSLSVVPWMPAMGHGASVVPTVTAEGDGRYLISDVELFMAGTWELRSTFAAPAGGSHTPPSEDGATPTFEIP